MSPITVDSLTIIAIFDRRDLNRYKFQPIKDRRDGATDFCKRLIFVAVYSLYSVER
jgi:hypothetical protein